MANNSLLDQIVPIRITWRSLLLWGLLSPLAAVAVFFLFRADSGPAWVQAIGSVGAILVSIWIAGAKDRRDDERAESQEKVCLETLRLTARGVLNFAGDINESVEAKANQASWRRAIEVHAAYFDQLKELKPVSMPTPDLVNAYLRLKGSLGDLGNQLEHAYNNPTSEQAITNVSLLNERMSNAAADCERAVSTRLNGQ